MNDIPIIGDMLVHESGEIHYILGVVGRIIFISSYKNKDCFYRCDTLEGFKTDGYILKKENMV